MKERKKILTMLVENNYGVTSRVSGMFSRRGFNLDSFTGCDTLDPRFSRITVVVHGDEQVLEQIEKQVRKLEDVVEMKNGVQKVSQKKMVPGYVLIHMIMNDDTWYVVRNTRGVTGFVGPGSKPVPLTDAEMAPLGIQREEVVMDYEEGDTVQVIAGAWADTVGVIQSINMQKQSLTINVELFGRETPVEIGFAEVKKM